MACCACSDRCTPAGRAAAGGGGMDAGGGAVAGAGGDTAGTTGMVAGAGGAGADGVVDAVAGAATTGGVVGAVAAAAVAVDLGTDGVAGADAGSGAGTVADGAGGGVVEGVAPGCVAVGVVVCGTPGGVGREVVAAVAWGEVAGDGVDGVEDVGGNGVAARGVGTGTGTAGAGAEGGAGEAVGDGAAAAGGLGCGAEGVAEGGGAGAVAVVVAAMWPACCATTCAKASMRCAWGETLTDVCPGAAVCAARGGAGAAPGCAGWEAVVAVVDVVGATPAGVAAEDAVVAAGTLRPGCAGVVSGSVAGRPWARAVAAKLLCRGVSVPGGVALLEGGVWAGGVVVFGAVPVSVLVAAAVVADGGCGVAGSCGGRGEGGRACVMRAKEGGSGRGGPGWAQVRGRCDGWWRGRERWCACRMRAGCRAGSARRRAQAGWRVWQSAELGRGRLVVGGPGGGLLTVCSPGWLWGWGIGVFVGMFVWGCFFRGWRASRGRGASRAVPARCGQ